MVLGSFLLFLIVLFDVLVLRGFLVFLMTPFFITITLIGLPFMGLVFFIWWFCVWIFLKFLIPPSSLPLLWLAFPLWAWLFVILICLLHVRIVYLVCYSFLKHFRLISLFLCFFSFATFGCSVKSLNIDLGLLFPCFGWIICLMVYGASHCFHRHPPLASVHMDYMP